MNERHERARYKERFVLSNALLTVKQTIRRTGLGMAYGGTSVRTFFSL